MISNVSQELEGKDDKALLRALYFLDCHFQSWKMSLWGFSNYKKLNATYAANFCLF